MAAISRAPASAAALAAPAAVLAHAAGDRVRIRLQGRKAGVFLPLVAAELAASTDVFAVRYSRASASLVLRLRPGSPLDGDGARVAALVREAIGRVAAGERCGPAPVESAQPDPLGLGLSLLQAFAL